MGKRTIQHVGKNKTGLWVDAEHIENNGPQKWGFVAGRAWIRVEQIKCMKGFKTEKLEKRWMQDKY